MTISVTLADYDAEFLEELALLETIIKRAAFPLILVLYFAFAGAYAVRTAAWQAPDEPAHYNYIAQVSENGCCPLIEIGDWDSPYLETLKSARFAPELLADFPLIQYEDHQPPLYYLIAAPLYTLTNGDLLALRLLSVIFGVGAVICAYVVARILFPSQRGVGLGAAAFIAFIPQRLAMMSAVNNDGLAELIVGLALLGFALYVKTRRVKAWHLGIIVGVGLLTKVSTIFLVGLIPLGILIDWFFNNRERDLKTLIKTWLSFALPVALIGGAWMLRNVSVYGFPDILGLGAHDRVVTDQQRTAALIEQIGFGDYLRVLGETTFNSFFGQLGWMGYPLPAWCYTLIFALLGAAVLGWLINFALPKQSPPQNRVIALVFTCAGLLAIAQFAYYNLEFLQMQGRYMYAGLIPFSLALSLGLAVWGRLIERLHPITRYVPLALTLAVLLPVNIFVIWRVLPLLAP